MDTNITNDKFVTLPLSQEVAPSKHLMVQFNDNVTLKLSTSSFLYKGSNFLQLFDIEEDNNITTESSPTSLVPILCPSSYVLDDNKTFYFNDKNDLLFMFTLDTISATTSLLQENKFINICKFLDIIEYENKDNIFSKNFILYITAKRLPINNIVTTNSLHKNVQSDYTNILSSLVMKHNIIHQLKDLHIFMRNEIKSILNYVNNESLDIQIRTCTPLFYNIYLSKHKEKVAHAPSTDVIGLVIKYGRIDIYELSTYKSDYYKYIHKYDNQLTYYVKETKEYKQYIKNCTDIMLEKSGVTLEDIKKSIEYGADINAQDKYGDSILHIASKWPNNIKVIKYLVENGANIHLENTIQHYRMPCWNIFNKPLNIASTIKDNSEVIKYLFDNSILKLPSLQVIDVNNFNDTIMPLFNVFLSNNIDIIKYLYESYISLYLLNGYDKKTVLNEIWPSQCTNWTILHFATRYTNDIDLIIYFIEQGVNVNLLSPLYSTPLDMMLQNNIALVNIDVIKYLVNHDLDIKTLCNRGETALHRIAHYTDNIEIIKYLIEQGADVSLKSREGKTLFDVAIKKRRYNIVSFLCKYYKLSLHKTIYYNILSLLPHRLTKLLNER